MAIAIFLLSLVSTLGLGANQQVLALEFEENDGATTFVDYSYSGNNGTCTNCPAIEMMGPRRFGSFDGVNDVINVPTATNLEFGTTSDFSISVWVLIRSAAAREGIVDKGGSTNDGFILWIADGNAARIGFVRGSRKQDESLPGANHLVVNRWHHIVAAVDTAPATDTVTLYDNGAAILTNSALANTATSATQLSVGGSNGTDGSGASIGFFDGLIDYLRIYKIKLTDAQVRAQYVTDLWEMRWEELFEEGYSGRIRMDSLYTRTWSLWPTFL